MLQNHSPLVILHIWSVCYFCSDGSCVVYLFVELSRAGSYSKHIYITFEGRLALHFLSIKRTSSIKLQSPVNREL